MLFFPAATDSTASDDDTPPPLPAKTRESDYSNLSDKESLGLPDYSSPIIMNNIMVSVSVLFYILSYTSYSLINWYICLIIVVCPVRTAVTNNQLSRKQ